MSSYNMTINLGSSDEGKKRSEAYRKQAQVEGSSLSAWVKNLLDKATGHKPIDTPKKSNPALPSEV